MSAKRLQRLGVRERILLLAAIGCILGLVVDNFVIRPMSARYAGLELEIDTERNTRDYQRSVLRAEEAIVEQFAVIQGKLGESMPVADAISLMRGEVDALAREAGVVLLSMKHREPRKAAYYDEFIVDISEFETDEPSLIRFLHELRDLPGTFRVTRLQVAPDRGGSLVKGSMTVTKVMMPLVSREATAAP